MCTCKGVTMAYRSPFGDTTFTKVFVGGLAWETPTDVMRSYFEQFGDILEAVIITDKNTGKSKGYGFVTFRDPDSARRACVEPNPMIDGRKANCNIASLGRPRLSPPRGRPQGHGPPYYGGNPMLPAAQNPQLQQSGAPAAFPPPPPPAAAYVYPPYGYATYPHDYGYNQGIYNPQFQQPQYYHQMFGPSSPTMGSPYIYGYSMQTTRGTFSPTSPGERIQAPPFLYYPTMGGSFPAASAASYPPPLSPLPLLPSTRQHPFAPSPDSQTSQQFSTPTQTEAAAATSETPNA